MAGCLICLIAARVTAGAENWPQFRGPTGQGLSDEKGLPIVWGGETQEHLLWQSPLIGEGHASPIVWGDRVFVATAHWPADVADKVQVIPEHHLLCYDVAEGRLLWDAKIPPGPWKRNDFRSGAGGGYAAPTPATDGRHVFCAYGSSVLAAVDFAGQLVWRNELAPHTFDVTLGSSPVLFGETVILLHAMANKADSRVVAYRKSEGAIAWQQPLITTGFGHSTPLLIQQGDCAMLGNLSCLGNRFIAALTVSARLPNRASGSFCHAAVQVRSVTRSLCRTHRSASP